MPFKEYFRNEIVPSFFIVTTCITLLMAVAGSVLLPEERFGFGGFFSPFIFSLISSALGIINYSRKELTPKQALIRKALHMLALEAAVLSVIYFNGGGAEASVMVTNALAIPVIYFIALYIMWLLDKRSCDAVNKALKELQMNAHNF